MLKPVAIVGKQPEVVEKKGSKGGSGMGQAIGAVAGGVIGSAVPGAGTAAGAMAGAAAGASLGGMIGNMASPATATKTAMERRAEVPGVPQLQSSDKTSTLKESIMALQKQPPQVQQEYGPLLVDAYMTTVAQGAPRKGMS
jgi:uncharacterized protein YcfJ